MTEGESAHSVTVTVENLGGIRSCRRTLTRGVSVLTGRNATNRTSFLRAVGSALGGTTGQLKADAESGRVTLTVDDVTYCRRFEQDGQSVRIDGDPYVDDKTLVDHYSCILADNAAREATRRGDGDALRAFVMAPVDTAQIHDRIETLRNDIDSLREDRSAAKQSADRRPQIRQRLEDHREELATLQSTLSDLRASVAEDEADDDTAQTVVEDLKDARETYQRVREKLQTQRSAVDSLQTERDDVVERLESVDVPDADQTELEDELARLQRRKRDLQSTIDSLLSVVEFNERLLDDGGLPPVAADGDVTTQLTPSNRRVECWTCGTTVTRDAIDGRLDDIRALVTEKRDERDRLSDRIDNHRSTLDSVRETDRKRTELEAELADIDAEITDREERIERFEERKAQLESRIEELEAEAAETDDHNDSDPLATYQRLSELEYDRGQLEQRIDSLTAELDDAKRQADRLDQLDTEIAARQADLADARNRIDSLERSAVEMFNEHMETVLTRLRYDNVERVWIERKVGADEDESTFELHVVRSTVDDVVYEDTVDHLSESECEVIGLVVALAGYLVHDVHQRVPIVLLDSLEAIDSDRIAALVDYFAEFVPFLFVALLPEDAAALSDSYDRVQIGNTSHD